MFKGDTPQNQIRVSNCAESSSLASESCNSFIASTPHVNASPLQIRVNEDIVKKNVSPFQRKCNIEDSVVDHILGTVLPLEKVLPTIPTKAEGPI